MDFPLFTQGEDTPDALLVQMNANDLNERSKKRVKPFAAHPLLSLETIRENKAVPPEDQIALAEYIDSNVKTLQPFLVWTFPRYKQFERVCQLIWEYLVPNERRHGVFSGNQLTFKAWQLIETERIGTRIMAELTPGQYAAKTPDEAVERVLQFDRNWAGFELPRLLMAVSRIQCEVLTRRQLAAGDYSSFAVQIENLFRPAVVAALDEYGIPLERSEKLQPLLGTDDDLDIALANLRRIDVASIRLSAFERDLVRDAQGAL